MRSSKKVFVAFLSSLFFLSGQAQSPENILDSINAGRKPEKLFTHFDKTFYQPGETIWFKTYIMEDGHPGISSSVAKAELIDESGAIITSQILPITIGTASGSLALPSTLDYGTYVFRLYTQQMLNTGSDNFYYRPIPVLSSASDFDKAGKATDISISFSAEGGSFLADELNILAFKAIDQRGRPANTSGTIKDSQGKEIVAFTTEYNGMGKVEITPKKGEQYTAYYTLPSGATKSIVLPTAELEGTNLIVVDELVKKRLIVSSRLHDSRQKASYIIGEMDQVIVFKIDISKSNGHFMGRVPVQELPGGLLHIAVFDDANNVLAERTCFVNSRKETIEPTFELTTTSLQKRMENSFGFSLPDSLEGVFSIAVTDNVQTQLPVSNDNIIAGLLVTSSLEASANHPLYSIGQLTGMEKNDAVDLLLLTHEYKWNWKALSKLAMARLPSMNENFISLWGRAHVDKNGKPVLQDGNLAFIIQTKDSAIKSFVIPTNAEGYFETPGLYFEDTATIYVRNNAEKNRDKKVELEIKSTSLPQKYSAPVQKDIVGQVIPAFLKSNGLRNNNPVRSVTAAIDFDTSFKMLEELVVMARAKTPTESLEKQYSKGVFAGASRTTIDFVNDRPNYSGGNIFDYLKGRYSYMQVTGNYPNYALVFRNNRSLGSGAFLPMALYLDEFQVDASMLITVPMNDIAMVRIYGAGLAGPSGALAVYTKRDAGIRPSVYDNTSKFSLPGFSKSMLFYSPDHTDKKINITTDNRKTLYWNASLNYIPEDGKLPITFFNTDNCKEYKIVLQGFTTDGKLVYLEKLVR